MRNEIIDSDKVTTRSMAFIGLLTIVFITLKLTGFITWSWVWVLSPLWIPTAFFIGVFMIGVAVYLLLDRRMGYREDR